MARADLVEQLRRQVVQSFAPGERLPTQRSLARMYEVGLGTINRAIRILTEEGLVQAEPRLGWVRAGAASDPAFTRERSRGSKRLEKIGLITRRNRERWKDSVMIEALLKEARVRGVEVVEVANPHFRRRTVERHRVILSRVPWNTFDVGLLVEIEDEVTLSNPLLARRAVLAVDQDATAYGLHSVAFADAQIGAMAARYLFKLGHRRFVVTDEVNDPGFNWEPTWTARRHSFETTLGRLGGVIRPEWRLAVVHHGWKSSDECVTAFAKNWSAMPRQARPTALFNSCNVNLHYLIDLLEQRGFHVPQDLSIITVIWNREYVLHQSMALTCLELSLETLVRRTFDAAEEILSEPPASKTRHAREARLFSAPTLLVPGSSTVPPLGVEK